MIRASSRPSARCKKLLVIGPTSAYCQPCVSPVWDTALTVRAMQEVGMMPRSRPRPMPSTGCKDEQLLDEPGDWRVDRPHLNGGGWAFQFANDYYPDLDDTAVVVWGMHQAPNAADYERACRRALDWLVGMQSKNGGFAAFDADNTSYYLNKIPFADHGALLDPPTSDVSARVVTVLGLIGRPQDQAPRSIARSRICAPSRRRTARGSDAGGRTTSTAPGRCSPRSRRRACRRTIRRCAARWIGCSRGKIRMADGVRPTTAT
jgi:squalene cyclase